MTPEERTLVQNLRSAVKNDLTPFYDTDSNMLRWLQGHHYNMDAIVPKLRHHLRYRKSSLDLDNMHNRPRDHRIQTHWPDGLTGMSGKDDNSIVNIEQAGLIDYWGMLQTHSLSEIMKSRVHDLELMLFEVLKHEKKTGKQSSIIYVMDLKGLQFDKRLLSIVTGPLKFLAEFMADHYVELIKYFVLVNAPSFMYHLWWIVRPLLPEHTRNKVRILSGDWRKEILDYADPSALPAIWNVNGERTFSAKILPALKFDENEYYSGVIGADFEKMSAASGKVEFVSVVLDEGATLKWTIHCDCDFGFGIFFCTDGENELDDTKMDMIYPQFIKVFGPTIVPLEDSFICEKAGVYKFWFSNRHSWWHSLKIKHKISIES